MDRLEIIEALKRFPTEVEREIAGLSEEQMRFRNGEGAWSIKEIIGHLRDVSEVWYKRINVTSSLFDPRFPAFDAALAVKERGYQEANLGSLITEMRDWRLKTVDIMVHTVDWTRIAQHPSLGRRSMRQWGEHIIEYEAQQLAAIRTLKQSRTAARLPS